MLAVTPELLIRPYGGCQDLRGRENGAYFNIKIIFARKSVIYQWLVQERRNSIANALELRLSCTNPLMYGCERVMAHYNNITWMLKHLKSQATSLFFQQSLQAGNKEIIKDPHTWSYVRGILHDSQHKGPIMFTVCTFHDSTMQWCNQWIFDDFVINLLKPGNA